MVLAGRPARIWGYAMTLNFTVVLRAFFVISVFALLKYL
jgi:hypothetical protein